MFAKNIKDIWSPDFESQCSNPQGNWLEKDSHSFSSISLQTTRHAAIDTAFQRAGTIRSQDQASIRREASLAQTEVYLGASSR
jgi:hypothetical protein